MLGMDPDRSLALSILPSFLRSCMILSRHFAPAVFFSPRGDVLPGCPTTNTSHTTHDFRRGKEIAVHRVLSCTKARNWPMSLDTSSCCFFWASAAAFLSVHRLRSPKSVSRCVYVYVCATIATRARLTAFGLVEELENLFGSSLHAVIGNARQQVRIAYFDVNKGVSRHSDHSSVCGEGFSLSGTGDVERAKVLETPETRWQQGQLVVVEREHHQLPQRTDLTAPT